MYYQALHNWDVRFNDAFLLLPYSIFVFFCTLAAMCIRSTMILGIKGKIDNKKKNREEKFQIEQSDKKANE